MREFSVNIAAANLAIFKALQNLHRLRVMRAY